MRHFEPLDVFTCPLHGIRQIELDIFGDAEGGRFAHPWGATLNAGGAAAFGAMNRLADLTDTELVLYGP